MTALVLAALLSPGQDRTAVKEVLANGATVYAQRIIGATNVSLAVSCVAKSNPEPVETHGLRHLAEHLIAKGSDKGIDARLEKLGAVLLAETSRDAVTFRTSLAGNQLAPVYETLQSLLGDFSVQEKELRNEIGVVGEELSLRNWAVELVADGWRRVYGSDALDPFGDPAALSKLTLEQVSAELGALRDPSGLAVVVVGDIDCEAVAKRLSELLGRKKSSATGDTWERPGATQIERVGSAEGEALSVPVSAFPSPDCLAKVAASFGARAWSAGSVVYYNPSPRTGVVTFGIKSPQTLSKTFGRLIGMENAVAQTGLQTLRQWLKEVSRDPAKLAKMSAEMFPLYPSFDPGSVGQLADSVTQKDVARHVVALVREGTRLGS